MTNQKLAQVYKSALDGRFYKCSGNVENSRRFEASGMVQPSDVSEIEAVTILDEVLGLARPQYTLRAVCRQIPMDQLTMRVDIATSLAGSEKVPALVEAEIKKQAYTAVNFDLWKNVVHVALADEAQMKAAHPLLQMHIEDAARDLARMENKQIAEILEDEVTEKVNSATYSDWGAVTSGVSNINPFTAIISHINYVQGKGYPVDFLAMHPTLFGKFIQNTYVRELVRAGMATLGNNGGNFTLPGYPTIRLITDYALTETPTGSIGPIIGSTAAPGAVLGTGPTMAAQYRNELAGYEGYIIRQWLQPKVVIQDALSKICT
jgi:hypothetical protein